MDVNFSLGLVLLRQQDQLVEKNGVLQGNAEDFRAPLTAMLLATGSRVMQGV